MDAEVILDGSEGGGQLVRSALALSLITGRPFRLRGLRSRRSPPGLRPQHLACIRGAVAISEGQVRGADVGSEELSFVPGPVRPGDYELDVGTAGSTGLVLHCLAYPLAIAGGGRLTLRGGTHVPWSPCHHYLTWVWQPAVRALGLEVSLALRSAGFHPEGGGEIHAELAAWREAPERLELPGRGTLVSAVVTSLFGGIPLATAERQGRAAAHALREHGILCDEEHLPMPARRSSGSAVFIRLQFERSVAGFTQLVERGASPESVGQSAAEQAARFMETAGAIDEHLADQLILPTALMAAGRLGPAGGARYRSAVATDHLRLHAALVERFLPVTARVEPDGCVEVSAVAAP